MKKYYKIFMLMVIALVGLSLTACDDGDDLNTDQYGNNIAVNAFGPCPVLRGGTLYFYGSNLDQIESIQLPGADPITQYEILEKGRHSKISITVPAEKCDTGIVVLTTKKGGEIRTITPIVYREDIKIDKFYVGSENNLAGNVGDKLTIKGDYLNLIHGIIFAENDTVKEDAFVTHDRYTIEVAIPMTARTGKFKLTDLAAQPSELESELALTVNEPTVSGLSNANPKAGETITVNGESLTQVVTVSLNGAKVDTADVKHSADGKSISFVVPAKATDGEVTLNLYSGVQVPAGSITTVVPTNLSAVPNPVKNGAKLTITGKDIDLITSISFPNGKNTEIEQQSATEIVTTVPEDTKEGDITLSLENGKTVSVAFTLVKASVTAVNPTSLMAGGDIIIAGKNLDLVASITFPTDQKVTEFIDQKSNAIKLTVPAGAAGTGFVLTMKNGDTVEFAGLTIQPSTNPTLTNAPVGNAGAQVTLEGKNYNNVEAVYIGTAKVSQYVSRSATSMTIVIPASLAAGSYDVTMQTADGQKYVVGKLTVIPNEYAVSETNCFMMDGSQAKFPMELTWDDNGRFRIMRNANVDLTKITWTPGISKIKIYKVAATTGQAQFNDANWSSLSGYDLNDWNGGAEVLEAPLTQEAIDCITGARADGWSETAFIIQGSGLQVTKITLVP